MCRCSTVSGVREQQVNPAQTGEMHQPTVKAEPLPASTEAAQPTADGNPVSDQAGDEIDSEDDDSGSWAKIIDAKSANGPEPSKAASTSSSNWNNMSAPKGFSGDRLAQSGENWKSISKSDSDFSKTPVDDFNRPVAHEIGKSYSGVGSNGSDSSGTNLGVSYSSGTNLGGAESSGVFARNASKKDQAESIDWVPVKQKPPEASKSKFADDAKLLDLTHKTETSEEKVRPTTRKSIQEAFRRNRIKTMVVAVIALAIAYGAYSYASSKGMIKKLGVLNQSFLKSNPQSKKSSARQPNSKRTR